MLTTTARDESDATDNFYDAVQRALRSGISATRSCAVAILTLHPWWITDDWLGRRSISKYRDAINARLESLLLPDDAVAVLTGGEWAVLLTNVAGRKEAAAVAERITDIVCQPVDIDGDRSSPIVSVGVAAATGIHRVPGDLVADAKAAMSQAVEAGAGQVAVFDEDLRLDILHRCRMVTSIGRHPTRSELELHFQPIMRLSDRQITAVEALIRWPGGEPIGTPAHIVSLAEQANLIGHLGEWVLQTACNHAARWADRGVVTHINVSPLQLMRRDLVDAVTNAIEGAGLRPEDIAIEITESTSMNPAAIKNIAALKDYGVRIALDDFGTGYANLASLRDLPIDIVKLDRSVVSGIADNYPARAMVDAVTMMAHALGLDVIAEGIETTEELAVATEIGCDLGQGYLLQRPTPLDAITDLLNADIDGRVA